MLNWSIGLLTRLLGVTQPDEQNPLGHHLNDPSERTHWATVKHLSLPLNCSRELVTRGAASLSALVKVRFSCPALIKTGQLNLTLELMSFFRQPGFKSGFPQR